MVAEAFAVDGLYVVEGSLMTHNDPVVPLLEPARNVSVILVSQRRRPCGCRGLRAGHQSYQHASPDNPESRDVPYRRNCTAAP